MHYIYYILVIIYSRVMNQKTCVSLSCGQETSKSTQIFLRPSGFASKNAASRARPNSLLPHGSYSTLRFAMSREARVSNTEQVGQHTRFSRGVVL
jgi:hypothetical protein